METLNQSKYAAQIHRQLATLKVVSRLLGHELHAQATSKTVTLTKDEVVEVQTCVDLFIEDLTRRSSPLVAAGLAAGLQPVPSLSTEITPVGARN